MKRNLWAAALVLSLGGCALFPPSAGTAPELHSPAGAEDPGSYTRHPPLGLPQEARSYLEKISRAFAGKDGGFLLAQGEAQFEADVRPRFDDGQYLALLFRAGSLSADSHAWAARVPGDIPSLDYRDVKAIEYLGWSEHGPLLAVEARLTLTKGPPLPCRILLVWKLRDPKILGAYP